MEIKYNLGDPQIIPKFNALSDESLDIKFNDRAKFYLEKQGIIYCNSLSANIKSGNNHKEIELILHSSTNCIALLFFSDKDILKFQIDTSTVAPKPEINIFFSVNKDTI